MPLPARLRRVATHWSLWLAVALGVRLVLLTDKSLWEDEVQRVAWAKGHAQEPIEGTLPETLAVRRPPATFGSAMRLTARNYPALFTWVAWPWMRAFGDSDLALRLLAALLGVAAVAATHRLARALLDADTAALSAWLAALSPLAVQYAQDVGQYPLATALVALSAWAATRFARSRRWGDALLWGVLGGLTFHAHHLAAAVVAVEALVIAGCWALEHRRAAPAPSTPLGPVLLRWLAATAVVLLLARLAFPGAAASAEVLPWGAARLVQGGAALARGLSAWALGEAVAALPPGPQTLPLRAAVGAALALLLLFAKGARAAWTLPRSAVAGLALGPALGLTVATLLTGQTVLLWPRYFTLTTVLFPVVGAAGLLALRPAARAVATVALAGAFGLGLVTYFTTPVKRPWRELAGRIDASPVADEVVLTSPGGIAPPLGRALQGPRPLWAFDEARRVPEPFQRAVHGRAGAWLVLAWEADTGLAPWLRAALRCQFRHEEAWSGWLVRALHFTEPTGATGCGLERGFTFPESGCHRATGSSSLPLSGAVDEALTGEGWVLQVGEAPAVSAQLGEDRRSFSATAPLADATPGSVELVTLRRGDEVRASASCVVDGP